MNERVLITEDAEKVREWLVGQFRAAGFRAVGVADGIEALNILLKSPPDAVVLDLALPRMNGADVLRRLRADPRGKDMPVIIITGVYKGKEHAIRARQAFGIDAYLEKPFQIEVLLEAVKKAIQKHQAPQPAKAPAAAQPVAPPQAPTKTSAEPPAPLMGKLADTPFDRLLLNIWKEHMTGILRIASLDDNGGSVERAFAFLSGRPVLGRSQADNEDFGTHLLSRGLATAEENREFNYLLSRKTRDAEDIFIRMGCLTPDGYIIERVRHLEELIIRCFALHDGDFRFVEAELEIGAVAGALIPRVFHEGYRRHLSEQRQSKLFQQLSGAYLCRTVAFFDFLQAMELDAEELNVAGAINGARMLKDHVEGDHFHKILKLLATFLALGMIEPSNSPRTEQVQPPYPVRKAEQPQAATPAAVSSAPQAAPPQPNVQQPTLETTGPAESGFEDLGEALSDELGDLAEGLDLEEPPPAEPPQQQVGEEHQRLLNELTSEASKLKNRNYYEYFDMKINRFRFEDMKKIYFEKRRKFSPENFIGWADGEIISVAEQVFSQLTTAFNTLSNVVSKEKYDELIESTIPRASGDAKVDRFQAQVQFESGKAFVEMGEWDSAEQSLREAIDLNPKEAAYHAWLAWAVYSKDKNSKAGVQKAKQEIASAIRMDPRLSIAFAFKGSMLLDEGNLDMAEVELKRALKFNPQSKHAKKELRTLEQRRESQKKGLFGKIFS